MPSHYVARANREKPGFRGTDKVVALDQSEPAADFGASEAGTSVLNGMVTFPVGFLMLSATEKQYFVRPLGFIGHQ
jgi:hypothetical protein